jgi:hypothetical protein
MSSGIGAVPGTRRCTRTGSAIARHGIPIRHDRAGAESEREATQRCLRDLAAGGQHFMVSDTGYEALGQFALGLAGAEPMR